MEKYTYTFEGKTYKVINPGRIVRINEIFYQNQLEDINNNFSVKFTRRKPIFYKYGLTEQQYYNLVVYGLLEHNEKCECNTCTEGVKMFNGLAYGYSRFCSGKCAFLQKGYDKSEVLKEQYKLGENPIYSKNSRCKSDYNRLIKSKYHKLTDEYSLYIAIPLFEKNAIKIGASSCIDRRKSAFNRNDYSKIIEITKSTLEVIAKFEYDIKTKFLELSISHYTEVFSIEILEKLLNYIFDYINRNNLLSSTTIEKVTSELSK